MNITNADEFSHSILLGFYNGQDINDFNSNNNSTNHEKLTEFNQKGSTLLKHIINYFDKSPCLSTCKCDNIKKELRKLVINLLFEENNSLKWWENVCTVYLMKMAYKIDIDGKYSSIQNFDDLINDKPFVHSIIELLTSKLEQLQKALYSIPETANSAPRAFIEADPNSIALILAKDAYNIEDDGFEIVDPVDN